MTTLDKEEFRIKLEEINLLVEHKNYKGAMNVVDSIDWRRVKNVRTLCVVGEIYAANKRYEESKEIFLLAYHRSSIGKNILYRLIEVSLKMGDIEEAMEFYEEYLEVAPNDNMKYVLKYKIDKARNASLEELIQILEEYKEKEFTEKWSYELANLYYQAGEKEKCLELCNQMMIWFNEGKYVMKAMDLKMRLGSLTGQEKERYEKQFVPNLMTTDEAKALKESSAAEEIKESPLDDSKDSVKPLEEEAPMIESIRMDENDINNAERLQEKISKGIRDIFGGKRREAEEAIEEAELKEEENYVPEEVIRDISSKLDYVDVPDLEPEEKEKVKAPLAKEEGKESGEEPKQDLSQTMQIPPLKIPKSMKNVNLQENTIPKAPVLDKDVLLADDTKIKEDDFNFNLEDTILAAASAQGIEIPEEPATEKKEPAFEEDEEDPDILQEEDLPEENLEETEDFEEASLEEPKEMPEKSSKRVIPTLEDEEFLSEEDLQEAEAEFLNGPVKKEEAKPEKRKHPDGMNTEIFNFQEEIKKVLGDHEDIFSVDPFEDSDEKEETEEKEDAPDFADDDLKEEEEEISSEPLSEEEELEQFIESIQPKNKRSPYDIIPRERELTDDEKKLFTYFVRVPGMKEQLVDTLCDVQMAAADKTSRTGNVIVMGGRETGKTRLISSLIPAICKELNLEASKVAYVFAEQINGRDMTKIVNKLSGGFLVIENANQLSQETAEQLDKAMEFRTDGLTVIVEDEKIGMRKFIARYPKLAKKFTSMINIPVFTNEELVAFARVYTKENGYTIDQMGMLALYDRIGMNQKADEPMNIGAVKELVDEAISKSQAGLRKFQRNISKKRTDHEGFIILYEKDFS